MKKLRGVDVESDLLDNVLGQSTGRDAGYSLPSPLGETANAPKY